MCKTFKLRISFALRISVIISVILVGAKVIVKKNRMSSDGKNKNLPYILSYISIYIYVYIQCTVSVYSIHGGDVGILLFVNVALREQTRRWQEIPSAQK